MIESFIYWVLYYYNIYEMKRYGRTPRGDGKRVKCVHCGYEWRTMSESEWVSCPDCMGKIKIERCLIK